MKLKNYLLDGITNHFQLQQDNQKETLQIKAFNDFTPFPFIHSERTTEDYIIYDMPSSFQLNIFDYSSISTASITFDPLFDVYYRESAKQNPHIDYPHKQNFYQISYVIDGQMDIILEGHRYSLPKDTICITNHNVKQVEERLSEFTAVHLCVKSEFIEDLPILQSKQSNAGTELIDFFKLNNNPNQQIDYLIFYPVQDEIKITISEISKTMFTEMMKKEIGYLEICKSYLQRMFYHLQMPSKYLCMHTSFSLSQERTLFEETLKYILDHKKKVSREEIGKALNYNGNYISSVFQKYAGITLAKYIRDICLAQAAHLLLNTNMHIREIIHELGYENKTAFYSNFYEKYGMSPGDYRERKQESK
ncbi:MAG: helix-turn-helix transcriptional regulator [Erysipelotrichaceae bacterium]|nr:helix-turn-helix transcriptional regulator [Erysipelotrichaceae bacterium]